MGRLWGAGNPGWGLGAGRLVETSLGHWRVSACSSASRRCRSGCQGKGTGLGAGDPVSPDNAGVLSVTSLRRASRLRSLGTLPHPQGSTCSPNWRAGVRSTPLPGPPSPGPSSSAKQNGQPPLRGPGPLTPLYAAAPGSDRPPAQPAAVHFTREQPRGLEDAACRLALHPAEGAGWVPWRAQRGSGWAPRHRCQCTFLLRGPQVVLEQWWPSAGLPARRADNPKPPWGCSRAPGGADRCAPRPGDTRPEAQQAGETEASLGTGGRAGSGRAGKQG